MGKGPMTEVPITTIAKALEELLKGARGDCVSFTCRSLLKRYGIHDTEDICRRAAVLFRALAELGYVRVIEREPRMRMQICRYDELYRGNWADIYYLMARVFESYVCKKALSGYKIT